MPLPQIPAHFERLDLVIDEVDPAALLRIARWNPRTHDRFRRRPIYRFDSPDRRYGTLYAAFELETAFVEAVLRDKPQRRSAGETVLITETELQSRTVVQFARTTGPHLRLISLLDEGLAAAHLDNRISTVDDYAWAQGWSRALHAHPCKADGLIYLSRFAGTQRSVALFHRCRQRVAVSQVTSLHLDRRLPAILDRYQIGIVK